jgi:hypothetical protein
MVRGLEEADEEKATDKLPLYEAVHVSDAFLRICKWFIGTICSSARMNISE